MDVDRQLVSLTLPDGVTRSAKRYGDQGCVAHPVGEDSVYFTPSRVARNLPPAATTPWPMGDETTPEVRENHAAYIDHWLKVVREDNRAIFTAAAHALRRFRFPPQPPAGRIRGRYTQ